MKAYANANNDVGCQSSTVLSAHDDPVLQAAVETLLDTQERVQNKAAAILARVRFKPARVQ